MKRSDSLVRVFRPMDWIMRSVFFLCATVAVFVTISIIFVLLSDSLHVLNDPAFSFVEFVSGTKWQPESGDWGALPLFAATFVTSTIALSIATPLGLAAAIYLSEYISPSLRPFGKSTLEILAGIPTVVFGFFALQFVTPLLKGIFGAQAVGFQNMLSAGIVIGIMILPTVASISEDAMSAVSKEQRDASSALGATRHETTTRIVFPSAISGITAAVIVATMRAFGETMIVAIAAGSTPQFTFNPLKAAETVTAHIVRISGGEISRNSIEYYSLSFLGLGLFIVTLVFNLISQWLKSGLRSSYH